MQISRSKIEAATNAAREFESPEMAPLHALAELRSEGEKTADGQVFVHI